ncbi:MAG: TolC family protein [Opitutales bacterium]|nr:TolC family protein [Opitutales bacterium]MBT5814953.1 TolC family protein [Opitutales bacterium]
MRILGSLVIAIAAVLPLSGSTEELIEDSRAFADPVSVVRLTYENNLRIAAARYEMEAAQYQFERFERRLSQFVPMKVDSTVQRESESSLNNGKREEDRIDQNETSIGFEKEFFDGKKIEAGVGAQAFSEGGAEFGNPFFQGELEMPLFSSFTRLERITERSFEESEMLEAWLDFIDRVNESANESQEVYFVLQRSKNRREIALEAMDDLRSLIYGDEMVERSSRDIAQIEGLILEYQSDAVQNQGLLESDLIELHDRLGLESLRLDQVEFVDYYGEYYYGREYLEKNLDSLIQEALASDIEIQIREIALRNAELKKRLAKQGKWDIIGKLFGRYDFDRQGDAPSRKREFFVGTGVSIRRNDPKLLLLSLKQADAEIRRFDAEIMFRKRQVGNLITRLVSEARNLRELSGEHAASRLARRAVFEQKRLDYMEGEESIENLLDARDDLYSTDRNLIETLDDFYSVIVNLDGASGFYFRELAAQLKSLNMVESYISDDQMKESPVMKRSTFTQSNR